MILNVFLQISTTDRILQIPIIGDIFHIWNVFLIGPFVLLLIFGIDCIVHYFLKKPIFFGDNVIDYTNYAYDVKAMANSNPIHLWLVFLIAMNSLFLKHSLIKNSEDYLLIFVAWSLGLIPGFIAYKKGRNFYNWWMYGHLLFIVAFPHSLLLKETEKSLVNRGILKKCHYCAEVVKKEAKVCKYCGNQLD